MKSIQNFLILLVIFYINGYFAEPIIGDEIQEEFNLIDNSNVNSNKLSDEIQRSELEQLVKTLVKICQNDVSEITLSDFISKVRVLCVNCA